MYGLLKGCCHSLTPPQRGTWRSHYCGVCASLGQVFGTAARLFNHYDTALVSLLSEAQAAPSATLARTDTRCPLPPCRPLRVPLPANPGPRFAGSLAILSAWAKLEDARADGDEPWVRAPFLSSWIRRLAARAQREMQGLGFDSEPIRQAVLRHPAQERLGISLETLLAPVETAYATAFAPTANLSGTPSNAASLRRRGASLGRLTYLCDAAADLEQDRTAGQPNLWLDCFRPDEARIAFSALVRQTWERLYAATRSLTLHRHGALLQNLVGEGLLSKAQQEPEDLPAEEGPMEAEKKKRKRFVRLNGGTEDCCCCCCHGCDCCTNIACCGEASTGCCEGCSSGAGCCEACSGAECCCCCC